MPLTTIRNNLSIFLALAAAMFGAYAFISHLHYKELSARYETLETRNASLITSNEAQATTINTLSDQRLMDDRIFNFLVKQQGLITAQGSQVRQDLQELTKHDESARDIYLTELPNTTRELLRKQATGGIPDNDNQVNPSGESQAALSNTGLDWYNGWRPNLLY